MWTDPEYSDEYFEQMLCDGLTVDSLEDAGYSCGYDLLDDDQDITNIFDVGDDESSW